MLIRDVYVNFWSRMPNYTVTKLQSKDREDKLAALHANALQISNRTIELPIMPIRSTRTEQTLARNKSALKM